MLFKKTNVEEKLRNYRDKVIHSNTILEQVSYILKTHVSPQVKIQNELHNSKGNSTNNFNIDILESDRIYHVSHIKKICIDYRLRFLDTKYFKGKIPLEAILEIKKLEKEHQIQIQGFKIIAPSKVFKLKNADDPLLFAPLGNDYFYLIHKWGNDLHPLRKLLVLPFKNFFNLTALIIAMSYVITELLPMRLFAKDGDSSMFWLLFIFIFKMVAGITLFYGIALGKNFNYAIWNSKYFNA